MGIIIRRIILTTTQLLVLNSSFALNPTSSKFEADNVRVKRQDGYVYTKPTISFDLPSRRTIVSTQAPTVDRTQAQQMYYAYPAPTGGDTVKNGYSPAGSTTGTAATSTGGSSGYNYPSQGTVTTGTQSGTASSGTQTSSGTGSQASTNPGSGGYAYNSQGTQSGTASGGTQSSSGTGSQTSTNSGSRGYAYNSPTPTVTSTNAPKYLPPTGGVGSAGADGGSSSPRGSSGTDGSTGDFSTSVLNGSSYSQGGSSSGVAVPSDTYLPPSATNSGSSISTGIQSQTSTTGLSVNNGYIPPNRPQPFPSPGPNTANQPSSGVPTGNYLPPIISTGSSVAQGSLSTPASTYLPPVF